MWHFKYNISKPIYDEAVDTLATIFCLYSKYINILTNTAGKYYKLTDCIQYFVKYVTENDIKKLMTYFWTNFQTDTYFAIRCTCWKSTRFHSWKFPLGLFKEQGGDSIHHEFAGLSTQFIYVNPDTSRLKKMMEEHFIKTNPENREIMPEKATGNLKSRWKQPFESWA